MAAVAPPPELSELPRAPGQARAVGQRRTRVIWCALALAFGLLLAFRASAPALADYYVVHDDVRQHVFWVPRLHDPELFRSDPIAGYFAAQAPPGFVATYFLGTLAWDAISFSKLLPFALTLLLAGFAFLLGLRLFRRSLAAGLGAVLLTWLVWQYDDIASATARSFATPLLVAFLAFLVAGQQRAALATLTIQALVYPIACPVMLGVQALWLVGRARGRLFAGTYRRELAWLLAAVALAAALVLLDQHATAAYGPVVSAEQARAMPEFQPRGRASYFSPDPLKFWLESRRGGLTLAQKDSLLTGLPVMTIPLALVAALGVWLGLGRLGLAARPPIPPRSVLLLDLLVSSFMLFFMAHLLFFRLYWPARQLVYSLPVVLALGGGLALGLALERLAVSLAPRCPARAAQLLGLAAVGLLVAHPPPEVNYVDGQHPGLYAYLRAQPKDTLVAALPADSSSLPLFAQRPVLVSFEHALPFHPGYYEPLRQRTEALLRAYYADSPGPLVELAEREGVGVIVANLNALERYRRSHGDVALGLETLVERCAALRDRELVAVPEPCARRAVEAPQPQAT